VNISAVTIAPVIPHSTIMAFISVSVAPLIFSKLVFFFTNAFSNNSQELGSSEKTMSNSLKEQSLSIQ
jgi:hypothetical protein